MPLVLALITTLVYFSCQTSKNLPNQQPKKVDSFPEAILYFNEAFEQIRTQYYYNKTTDFNRIKTAALDRMANARTYADTYEAIRYVLSQLSDTHSFFSPPKVRGMPVIQAYSNKSGIFPFETLVLDGNYGVIKLKSYNSVNTADRHQIADSLYRALKRFGDQSVKGLIIDFRLMEGGTTLPFLCGFAPLINQNQLLGYIDCHGHKTQIVRYKNGIYNKDGKSTVRLGYLSNYEPLAVSSLPIAIITGKYTASAGEMILISFLGLPNVRTFGQPTYGVPTGKSNIFLKDSAFISLTNTITYDRNRKTYDTSIQPDVIADDNQADTWAKNWLDKRLP